MTLESQVNENSAGIDGYTTDQSTTQLRRSRRSASVISVPNMVMPSSDSCVAVIRPTTQKRQVKKSSDVESVQSTNKRNRKKQSKPNKTKQTPKTPLATASKIKTAKPAGNSKKGKSASATEVVCIFYYFNIMQLHSNLFGFFD
jgi:hypothetical protein